MFLAASWVSWSPVRGIRTLEPEGQAEPSMSATV
jgi:hypothetical protein